MFRLLERFDSLSTSEENRFTKQDIKAGLQAYKDPAVNYPRDTIAKLSGIEIKENKRNYRTQSEHIKVMNAMKRVKKELGESIGEGRPSKKDLVQKWRLNNPLGKKIDCERELGISRHTVLKWWDM